nr:F-box domain containing protein [Pandoravirus aubagnensis]
MTTTQMAMCLDEMPVEMLAHIFSYLAGPSLALVGATCRVFYQASIDDRLWMGVYRRDFSCDGPPCEHVDYAQHGKTMRWLYAMRAVPTGRAWKDPVTRRQCARISSHDSGALWSGEFSIGIDPTAPEAARRPALLLDGYGAHVSASGEIREGMWRLGAFVGPGRSYCPRKTTDDDDVTVYCPSFTDNAGNGRGSIRLGSDLYEGGIANDTMHGFGYYKATDRCDDIWGEWANGKVHGRAFFTNSSCTFSGQTADRKHDSSIVPASGVKRTHDGSLIEGRWDVQCRPIWQIERHASCIVRSNGAGAIRIVHCESPTTSGQSVCARSHTTITVDGNYTRTDDRRTGGVAASCTHNWRFLFVAVPDTCDDPCLAGRRFFIGQDTGAGWMPTDDQGAICAPRDPSTSQSHAFYRYLASADCLLPRKDVDAARAAMDNGKVDTEAVPTDVALSGALGLPFGRVVSTDLNGQPLIRCFLTGTTLPAAECVVMSSGRAYGRAVCALWRGHPHWGRTDPETGERVDRPRVEISWRTWMIDVEPRLLSCAITRALESTPSDDSRVASDVVRYELATLTGHLFAARQRSLRDALEAITQTSSVRQEDLLIRDFDGLAVADIEFRHPEWDPRGPWRLGTPDRTLLPEDTTIGDHERDSHDHRESGFLNDLLDTHGIIRLALVAQSFMGTQLDGVFFLGHTFGAASFVGARLSDCLFVDCHFTEDVFAAASIARCRLITCTMQDGSWVDSRVLSNDRHGTHSPL